ncbi:MAG: cell division protein SepF [Eubacteriales bacterium]|nr:cell division protein SepF [Eubacteriales bacterium]
MGFLDSIMKGFSPEDEDKPLPNTLEEMVRTSGTPESGRARVIVVEPMRMEECNALVECIRHGLVVIINTENLEGEFSRRIVDFLTGATRAIDGRSLRINRTTYIFAPADIDVAIRRKEKKQAAKASTATAAAQEVPQESASKGTPVHRVVPDEAATTVAADMPTQPAPKAAPVEPKVVSSQSPAEAPEAPVAPVEPKEEAKEEVAEVGQHSTATYNRQSSSDTILFDGLHKE